jgi:hypothetical protein
MPKRETVGLRTIVDLIWRSTVAKVALALLVLLSAAEAIPAVRRDVTQELPFTTSVVSGILMLIVTVTVVEGYLARLEAANERRDRRAAEQATRTSSNRVFSELAQVVKPTDSVVSTAHAKLVERRDAPDLDREALAKQITDAAEALTRTLNGWLPLLLARDDLNDALYHTEDALGCLEVAAWLVGEAHAADWEDGLPHVTKCLNEHAEWFWEQELGRVEAAYVELSDRMPA